jgi:hypothetical protein
MTDHLDSVEEPNSAELATIRDLLARSEVWNEPPIDLEDRVVTAITTLATADARPASLHSLGDHRSVRNPLDVPGWLAAAAVVVLVVAGLAYMTIRGGEPTADTVIALVGTAAAPDASANAALTAMPAGLKIVLDVEGLAAAPNGYFYEAWISNETIRVSAGTFHLRGSDKPIELWAGVTESEFDMLAVTLEPLDGNADSSGDVRLRGVFDLGGG